MSNDLSAGGGFIGGGIVRYTFSQALPLGTHVYMQDVDQNETATLRFYNCAGTLIDPSGFDYLRVSTLYTPNATFTTNNVALTDSTGNQNRDEPLVAVIIRDPNVCRIDYTGTFSGGTWETYFSLPPTDLSVVKSLATPNPLVPGGPVSWTVTLTNTSPATGIAGLSNPAHAYAITMSDTVNSSVTGLTATVTNAGGTTGGSCTVGAGNAVGCSGFSHLAHGSSIVITLSGTLAANYSGATLANSATATIAVPNDTTSGNNTNTSTTPVVRPVTLTKTWVSATAGNAVSLAISGGANVTNIVAGNSTAPATTTNATALVGGAGTVVTLAEAFTTGTASDYVTTLACTKTTDASVVAVTGSGLSRTITMPSDSAVQCTFVNTRNTQLQLRKTWVNAKLNDAVSIPATTGFATNTAALSSVATTANETDSGAAVNVLVGATGNLPTESFTTGSASNYTTTGWVCTDGGSTVNVAQGGSLTIPVSSAGSTLVCTLTNTRRQATLALAKTWIGAVVNDTASLQSSGGSNNATLASVANSTSETDTGGTVNLFAGEVLTLSETLGAANVGLYNASVWSCTGTSGLSGSAVTIGGADTAIVCSITNSRQSANLSITKTNTPGLGPNDQPSDTVASGGTTTYTIVVTNNGPAAANNAIVIDDWTTQPGLDCSASAVPPGTATCTASGTGGTQCPASVTPAGLQAGLAIPVLPNGGIVTFTLQCAVTATGL